VPGPISAALPYAAAFPGSPTSSRARLAYPGSPSTVNGQVYGAGRRSPTPGSLRMRSGLTPSLPSHFGSPVRLPVTMQNPPSPIRHASSSMAPGVLSPARAHPGTAMLQTPTSQGSQSPVKKPVAQVMPDFLEEGDKIEKWLSAEAQRARRGRLGLQDTPAAAFADAREFISLGCFCGVARALQALGVKNYTYPFDWVRAPADGVIHCLDKKFEDFLTFTNVTRPASVKQPVYASTRWGGSFWHHDPSSSSTAGDFTRRAERFLGLGDVPAEKPRVFVRSVNSTVEVASSVRMLTALRRAMPKCEVRLLVLVDLQTTQGPRCVKGYSSDELLFYFLHEDIFAGTPTQPGSSWTMERHAEAYTEAIAFACNLWAGGEGEGKVLPLDDFEALEAAIEQWDGGSATGELFFPRKFQGPRLTVGADAEQQQQVGARQHRQEVASVVASLPLGGGERGAATPRRFPSTLGAEPGKLDAKGAAVLAGGLTLATPDNSPLRRRTFGGAPQLPFGALPTGAPEEMGADEASRSLKAQALAPLAGEDNQTAEFLVPGVVAPGGAIEASVFGSSVRVVLPEGAAAGQWLRLHLANGVVSCERLAAAIPGK